MPFLTYQRLLSSPDLGNVLQVAVLAFCAKVFNGGMNVAEADTAAGISLHGPADYSCPTCEHPDVSDL